MILVGTAQNILKVTLSKKVKELGTQVLLSLDFPVLKGGAHMQKTYILVKKNA